MYGWFSGLLTLRNGLSIFDAGEDEVCFEEGFDAGMGRRSSSTGTREKMPSIGSRVDREMRVGWGLGALLALWVSQRGGNWPPPALATSVSTDPNLLEHQTHRHFSFKMALNSSKLWNLLHQSLSMAYTEDDVRNACFAARRYGNVSRIARFNGIPRFTLQ